MGKIKIKFGYPTSIEEQEMLSERAIENDCSIETALCFEFKYLLHSFIKRKDKSFFDLVFLVIVEKEVRSPRISFGIYIENGYKFPMIVLEDDYLKVGRSEKLFISNEFIDEFGKFYQTEFDYEYVGLERAASWQQGFGIS